ncbi:HAMP domain-containing protein, partial [Vibrio parahaemolyticus]
MGSALTNRILRRMGQMTRAAARIQANDFAQRLPVTGTDEFSEMAATFNALLARREEAFEEQQRSLELQRRF